MKSKEHENSLGPCPWCGSEEHCVTIEDEGTPSEDFWGQCKECNQCSPNYPTIETLRKAWSDLYRASELLGVG